MPFSIDSEVTRRFAGLKIGKVDGVCTNNAWKTGAAERFVGFRESAEAEARRIPVLAEHANVAAWRKAFKAFGADPSRTKPSAEALLRRVQKGETLPAINPIVDIYNAVSIRHALPLGGQDAEKIDGGVTLRFSKPDDVFTPLGSGQPQTVDSGEVVYADASKVLCSKWNWRDCVDARIRDDTVRFVLFVDGAPQIPRAAIESATSELAEKLDAWIEGCKTAWTVFPIK